MDKDYKDYKGIVPVAIPFELDYYNSRITEFTTPVVCEHCHETREYYSDEMIYEHTVFCEHIDDVDKKGNCKRAKKCDKEDCFVKLQFCSYNCRSKFIKKKKEEERQKLREMFGLK